MAPNRRVAERFDSPLRGRTLFTLYFTANTTESSKTSNSHCAERLSAAQKCRQTRQRTAGGAETFWEDLCLIDFKDTNPYF